MKAIDTILKNRIVTQRMIERIIDCNKPYNGPITLDPDYIVLINYAKSLNYTVPSYQQQIAQSQFMSTLKALGIWQLLDVLYVYLNDGSKEFATLNWKSPAQFQRTMINGIAWTTNAGFRGNGTNSYLGGSWIPSVHGVNYQLNDASMFFQTLYEVPVSTKLSVGVFQNSPSPRGTWVRVRQPGNTAQYAINGSNLTTAGVMQTTLGFYHTKRTSSTALALLVNGVAHSSGSQASVGLPTYAPFGEAYNNEGFGPASLSDIGLAIEGWGSSLTGLESGLYNAWNKYTSDTANYHPMYRAVIDKALTLGFTLPSYSDRFKQNQFMTDLVSTGIFFELDALRVMIKHSGNPNFTKIDWINPNRTLTDYLGTMTPTSLGITFDQFGQGWANSQINPSTLTKYTQNNAGVFAYFQNMPGTVPNGGSRALFGCEEGSVISDLFLGSFNTAPASSVGVNTSGSFLSQAVPVNVNGLTIMRRTSSSVIELIQNGTSYGNLTSNSVVRPNAPIGFGCRLNQAGALSIAGLQSVQMSIFGIGASLTGFESTLKTITDNFYNA